MLSLLPLVALGSVELCTYIDLTPGGIEDCSGDVTTGSCQEVYDPTIEIDACTPTELADGSMGAVKVKECTDSYWRYELHGNADCSDDVSKSCASFVTGVNKGCTQTYAFGTCETLVSYSPLLDMGMYQKLTGACPGADSDGPKAPPSPTPPTSPPPHSLPSGLPPLCELHR